LKTALEKLQSWGNDASPIFEGDQLFMDIQINKDDIYESLFDDADPELDSLTQIQWTLAAHLVISTDLRNLVNDFCGKTKLLYHKIEY
jgi:hypothetical protein